MPSVLELMRMSPREQRDYLMNQRLDIGNNYARYGLESPVKAGDVVEQAMGALPGLGDAISAKDMIEALQNKDWKGAGLSSLGLLPFVGAIRDPAKSATTPLTRWQKEGLQRKAFGQTDAGAVEHFMSNLVARQQKVQGTSKDPVYRLIDEGIINPENLHAVFRHDVEDYDLDTINERFLENSPRNVTIRGVSHKFRQQQGTKPQTQFPYLEDYYDTQLLARAVNKSLLHETADEMDDPYAMYKELPDFLDTPFMKEQKGKFPVFGGVPISSMEGFRTGDDPLYLRAGLVDALKRGTLTRSALENNRIGLPEVFKYAEDYKNVGLKERLREGLSMVDTQHVYDDGWMWDKLEHPRALEAEGEAMNHCVGGYCDKVSRGHSAIYSLRDPEGNPHITIELDPTTNRIRQTMGKANSIPKEQYTPYIKHLTQELFPFRKAGLIPPEDQI